MQNNLISAIISAADQASVISDITDMQTKLAAVLIFNLTPKERKEMLKMGDKTLAFVQKALEYADANPSIVPAFLNLDEAKKDLALAQALYIIYQKLGVFTRAVEDAMMLSGGEAYDAALVFYAAAKGATKNNVAGSQAIYDDLKERFPRKTKATAKNSGTTTGNPPKQEG